MSEAKMSMKILVDKSKDKVLFAEAGKECVDIFLHILSLPLGTVVGYLTKSSMVGSIGTLYESLESLNNDYLQDASLIKDCLLNPKPAAGSASQIPLLTINQASNDPSAKKFFTCTKPINNYCCGGRSIHNYVSVDSGATCPTCQLQMNHELDFVATPADVKNKARSVGGYVKGVVTYMIMDDLSVKPMSTISSITLLNKFNVQDVGRLEEREVTLDVNSVVALLKASLMSKTVLSDVFLGKKAAGNN